MKARIDPLNLRNTTAIDLRPEAFGFSESYTDKLFASEALRTDKPLTLREYVQHMQTIYCGAIGLDHFIELGREYR